MTSTHTPSPHKSVAYYTLGCKLNFAETSTIAHHLEQLGYIRAKNGEVADIVVVNTCAVTEQATAKCRQQIRRLIRRHPGARVVVTGCYAQIAASDVAAIEGVDLVVGAEWKGLLPQFISGEIKPGSVGDENDGNDHIRVCRHQEIRSFHHSCSHDDRTRHFLKVQDGCDYFCTYCTIPMARGRSRNPSIESLVKVAHEVAANGGREIVLTGVNIGDFGKSNGETFFDLIRTLDEVEGIERYRISSIEPNLLTDEMIAWVATSRRFAPHFHIPLQAGSDEVLRLMHRRYDTALFRHKIELIKQLMPHAFIGVDVMAGMRGETPELFDSCHDFLSSLPVSQLHPFTYSERSGTRALQIEPIVPIPERHERTTRLVALSEQRQRAFYESQWGSKQRVLWEQPPRGERLMHGFTDNYIRVVHPYVPAWIGTCRDAILSHTIEVASQGLQIPVIDCETEA